MTYVKREKYTVINDADTKTAMLDTLIDRGIPKAKARQLVFYPAPMSLIRWSNYLEPNEFDEFLEPLNNIEEDMGF